MTDFSPLVLRLNKEFMKIAISGKGGVGKTTLAGSLARHLAAAGNRVLAIDADPDSNLPSALGIDSDRLDEVQPLASLKKLIEERTGAKAGTFGGMFKMNPRVDDIHDEYSLEHEGIKLLTLGTVPTGGTGCLCPESTLLRGLRFGDFFRVVGCYSFSTSFFFTDSNPNFLPLSMAGIPEAIHSGCGSSFR